MKYYDIGDVVFGHSESISPWPAKVVRVYNNWTVYKVNFYNHYTSAHLTFDMLEDYNEETKEKYEKYYESNKSK
jgi:hypothetical protein